ncbi:hypothetical protein L7F22_048876 [Adiantum nelumboides]|nr:hypothetical protein [Adiantum nelumboides]
MEGTMQRTPRKCAAKAQTPPPPAKTEFSCKASSKASRKGGSKDKLVYPKLKRFCLSKEELKEEYGLSLVGKLPKDLSKEDISEEDGKFCGESLFAGQRPSTSEGLDRTTGSFVVTKVVEVMSKKNSAEEMEKALMELAAEDGVNAVQKMMEQEVNKEGEQEVNKEGEQKVSKEGEQEISQEVSKEGEQETVEEIEIDRVPPVYKNPSKYVNVKDPSRPAVLIDLQGVLIYSHFIGGKEAPPNLDANEHIQVEEPPYCYFVRKDAEQFLVLACYFANVFIWSLARLRNVERRVQRLFPSAAEWLSGLIGQELCDVANFNLSMGKPIFFKTLLNFWRKFPRYNEGNTDDQ